MADEIKYLHDDGAETVYCIIRDMTGQFYDCTTHNTFEAFDVANWGDYDIPMTEISAAGSGNVMEKATWPAALTTAGYYWLDFYVQPGASAAQTDHEVASMLVYWDGSTVKPAEVKIGALLDVIVEEITVPNIVDGVLNKNLSGHNEPNSVGKKLKQLPITIQEGEARGGSETTIILSADASIEDDFYFPGVVVLMNGGDVRQSRRIESYDGETQTVTVATPWTVAPQEDDEYQIIPWASVRVSDIDDGVLAEIAGKDAQDAIKAVTDKLGTMIEEVP